MGDFGKGTFSVGICCNHQHQWHNDSNDTAGNNIRRPMNSACDPAERHDQWKYKKRNTYQDESLIFFSYSPKQGSHSDRHRHCRV